MHEKMQVSQDISSYATFILFHQAMYLLFFIILAFRPTSPVENALDIGPNAANRGGLGGAPFFCR